MTQKQRPGRRINNKMPGTLSALALGILALARAEAPLPLPSGSVSSVLTASGTDDRLSKQPDLAWKPIAESSSSASVLRLNTSNIGQKILGFGSALTESAGFNFAALSPTARNKLVQVSC